MSDRHFNGRDVAVTLGVTYVVYGLLRAIATWPLLCLGIWGAVCLSMWLFSDLSGWAAIDGFVALLLIVVLIACASLLASGRFFSAMFLFAGFMIMVQTFVHPEHCVGDFCYAVRESQWDSIQTPYGYIHELPPGGWNALPVYNPGPGLFERLWMWVSGLSKNIKIDLIVGLVLIPICVLRDSYKARKKDEPFLEQRQTRLLR